MTIHRATTAGKGAKAVDALVGRTPNVAHKRANLPRKRQITIAHRLLARTGDNGGTMGQIGAAVSDRAIDDLIERVAT